MPVTATAKRALRVSKRKQQVNSKVRANYEAALRVAQNASTKKNKQTAESAIDKAAKRGLIHKNKAARLKSQLAKLKK